MKKPSADQLVKIAIAQLPKAYASYSHYHVGAAVLADNGDIYTGVNIENAVYPLTLCAERVAIFKAISEGATAIQELAVATQNGGTPCGSCRQVMREFANPDLPVHVAKADGSYFTRTLRELLPDSFSAQDLENVD